MLGTAAVAQSTGRSQHRIAAFIVAALIHIALIICLVSFRMSAPSPPVRQGSVTSLTLSTSSPEAPAMLEPLVLPSVSHEVRPVNLPTVATETDALGQPNQGTDSCAPLQLVADAIAADPIALTELEAAPRAMRSVADAIVVWNRSWDLQATAVDAPLTATRLAVERSLGMLDPTCLDLPISGPRFLSVIGTHRSTTLVFGSGVWGWGQLLDESLVEPTAVTPEFAPIAGFLSNN